MKKLNENQKMWLGIGVSCVAFIIFGVVENYLGMGLSLAGLMRACR